MSNQSDEPSEGITDQDLPEDLQPTDDNPLAQPLSDEDSESVEELDVLGGGKGPEQSADSDEESDETDDSQG